jgi:HemY protein
LAQILSTQADGALDAYRLTERLCRESEALPESRAALAEAALTANIWGEARRHLIASVNDGSATQNIYRLLAKLERREHHDERAALSWLGQAADAAPDQAWLCHNCSGTLDSWQPICSHCGTFDSVDWQQPGQRRASLPSLCDPSL